MTHDLKLCERTIIEHEYAHIDRVYRTNSSVIVHHLYLCAEHWPEIYDFMDAYEGGGDGNDVD